jgi:hypothetical protein
MWAPDGTSTNLTTVTNDFGALGSVHWPWIVWSSTSQPKYTFYNVDTGVTVQAPAPPARSIGWTDNDFTLSNGQLILYFLAQDGNVYRWRQDTGVTTALTSSGLDCCVQTDGVRAAWEEAPANGWSPSNLVALDIASGAQQTLSTSVSRFSLADGLLAWSEKTSNSAAVKVSDGNTITTLTTRTTSLLFRAGGGHVAYQDDFKLYAWDPGTGAHVVLEASPGQVFLSGNVLYFTNGARQTVYAVTLN